MLNWNLEGEKRLYNSLAFQKCEVAFTLAEVLITLGIIGIVAAMTMPVLMQKHDKSVVETKLKHFYSLINQAVRMSIIDNGEPSEWFIENTNYTYEQNYDFLNKYLLPYLKHNDIKRCIEDREFVCVDLANGTSFMFRVDRNGADLTFYTKGKPVGNKKYDYRFQFYKMSSSDGVNWSRTSINTVEPYSMNWTGEFDDLKNNNDGGCYKNSDKFCTKLIQMNGWKIPDDYPW